MHNNTLYTKFCKNNFIKTIYIYLSSISPWNLYDATLEQPPRLGEIGCFEVERNRGSVIASKFRWNASRLSFNIAIASTWMVHRYEFPVARPFRFPRKIIATPAARKYWMVIAEQPRFLAVVSCCASIAGSVKIDGYELFYPSLKFLFATL